MNDRYKLAIEVIELLLILSHPLEYKSFYS